MPRLVLPAALPRVVDGKPRVTSILRMTRSGRWPRARGRSPRGAQRVRADVIRQFHERGATDTVELLILCEEDDFKRAAMTEALRSLSI
jgi:hypothetical protein